MRILLTGANGFVGSHLRRRLSEAGHRVVAASRKPPSATDVGEWVVLDEDGDFAAALEGCEALIHAAGATPANSGAVPSNYEGSLRYSCRLAEAVPGSAVRTVIHLSSVAALGGVRALAASSIDDRLPAAPATDYGRSKREAELAFDGAAAPGRLVANLRLPLVFGPGAQGSWAALSRLAASGLPLPFASVANRRSFLGIGNLGRLVEAILASSGDGERSGTYVAADRELVSLREVCTALRSGLDRRAGLFPFPPALLSAPLRWAGREEMAAGLFADLVIDASRARETFGWDPVEPTLEAMARSLSDLRTSSDR